MVQVFSSLDLICCFYLRVHSIVFRHHKLSPHIILATTTIQFINGTTIKDLGQFPPKKIASNPKTKPKPNPNPNQGSTFLGGNCLVAPNPKTDPDLDPNPKPNWGAIFLHGNCPDTNNNGQHYLSMETLIVLSVCSKQYKYMVLLQLLLLHISW